jgi:hypothetical protein
MKNIKILFSAIWGLVAFAIWIVWQLMSIFPSRDFLDLLLDAALRQAQWAAAQERLLTDGLFDLAFYTTGIGGVGGAVWLAVAGLLIRIEDPLDVLKWSKWWRLLLILVGIVSFGVTYIILKDLPRLQPGRSLIVLSLYTIGSLAVYWIMSRFFTRRTVRSVVLGYRPSPAFSFGGRKI